MLYRTPRNPLDYRYPRHHRHRNKKNASTTVMELQRQSVQNRQSVPPPTLTVVAGKLGQTLAICIYNMTSRYKSVKYTNLKLINVWNNAK